MRGNKHVPPTHTHLPPTVLDTHTQQCCFVDSHSLFSCSSLAARVVQQLNFPCDVYDIQRCPATEAVYRASNPSARTAPCWPVYVRNSGGGRIPGGWQAPHVSCVCAMGSHLTQTADALCTALQTTRLAS